MVRSSPPKAKPRKALGRGLSSLLPERGTASPSFEEKTESDAGIRSVPLSRIRTNPAQPRRTFDPKAIEELAQSIRTDGIIQPIVVKQLKDGYLLVVGERRLRAARIAGMNDIPVIVSDIGDSQLLQVALVENIQREDLNPIEVATALRQMAQEGNLSHEDLAGRTGKDRTTITNLIRLLRLPDEIQQLVSERRLSMGHARALLALNDADQQLALADKTAAQGLSVRQVERTVRELNDPRRGDNEERPIDPNVAAALEKLEEVLGTKVRLVQRGRSGGKIEVEYYSDDDLDRIYTTIVGTND